jgi:hypothetical protein
MSGLTNKYVEDIGKKILGKIFLGTFPCDFNIQTKGRKVFCLIFNLSKHNTKGSHFVAIYTSKNEMIYFDSYGKKPTNKDIKAFISKNIKFRKLIINKKCIQSCSSIFCGFYCLGFLLSQKLKIPLKSFTSFFDLNNTNNNDGKIIEFIQKYV